MTVISISVIESQEQIVSGIPRTITLESNIAATIYYTLDGTTPTIYSDIYLAPIKLPTNKPSITLSYYADNGTDSSPVMSNTYFTDVVDNNARFPRNNTNDPARAPLTPTKDSPLLFGSGAYLQNQTLYLNPGDAGESVNNDNSTTYPSNFDGEGNPTSFTALPYNLQNYNIKYDVTNSIGQYGPGIGNLPAHVIYQMRAGDVPPEESHMYERLFNPRAQVVYQDSTKEKDGDPVHINRFSYSIDNEQEVDDSPYNFYIPAGGGGSMTTGNFVRSCYNERTGMETYYYFDSSSLKWIISTQPYNPANAVQSLAVMYVPNTPGGQFIWRWDPFSRRYIG